MQESITAVAANTCAGETCDLYRFFDAADRLLYVGISKELPTRWRSHAQFKEWWPAVVRATIEHYGSREEAEAAELRAIIAEYPLWNIRDAPQPSAITAAVVARHANAEPVSACKSELTPSEAAAELGVSTATIRRWESSGVLRPSRRLPGSGHRRYSPSEVAALRTLIADPVTLAALATPSVAPERGAGR